MRRELPTIVLLAIELLLAGFTLFFHRVARPDLLRAYRDSGTELPIFAALSLGTWLLPSLVGLALLMTVAACLRRQRSGRLRWLAVAVGVHGAGFTGAVLAAYLPLLG